jgi:hypothetical protein
MGGFPASGRKIGSCGSGTRPLSRPVIPAFIRQPSGIAEPQPVLTEPTARTVAELFSLGYEILLQLLTRSFTRTDGTDEQLGVLME